MDITSTSSSSLTFENLIRKAIISASYGSPSDRVLDFIRNYSITSRNSENLS